MRIQVIVNPADDSAFVRTVREIARHERSHREFEAILRTTYPSAKVRHGDLSGRDGERWYVYRDGNWAGDGADQVATTTES